MINIYNCKQSFSILIYKMDFSNQVFKLIINSNVNKKIKSSKKIHVEILL